MSPKHRAGTEVSDQNREQTIETAKRWLTEPVSLFLVSEVQNEQFGGVAPATLASAIDSLVQGLDVFDLHEADYVALLAIVGIVGTDTEVRELL